MAMAPGSSANRAANIWTARIIPILLLAIIAYASFVVTKVECVDYLLRPDASSPMPARPGAAIAILTVFYILLCFLLVSYARLVSTILTNPGVVPRGPQWYVEQAASKKRSRGIKIGSEKEDMHDAGSKEGISARGSLADADSYRVQDFWLKDTFVCQYDGRPKFCSHCFNFKVDRVHHCSELGRCVYKMDHFCPWVGGIVSETSFKFFIQFTFWTSMFCVFNVIHLAYFLADRQRRFSNLNVHWILALALSGLFLLFGMGMCISSLQFAFENTTTIENLDRRTHVYYIAVHVPYATFERLTLSQRDAVRWISYPRPPQEQLHLLQDSGANHPDVTLNVPAPSTVDQAAALPASHSTRPQPPIQRTFAIMETPPGANPFNLGLFENFKQVMGNSVIDWILPIRHSPCAQNRSRSPHSMYKMGRVVYKLKKQAGILEEGDRRLYGGSSKRSRKKRPSSAATSTRSHNQEKRQRSQDRASRARTSRSERGHGSTKATASRPGMTHRPEAT